MIRLSESIKKYSRITERKLVNIKRRYVNWNGSITYNDHTVYKNVVIKKGIGVSTIQMLSRWDPSGCNKYLDWMLKTKMGTTLTLTEIKSFVTLFHTSPQKFTHKDLYKYKTTAEIKKQLKSAESKMSKKEMKLFGCEIVKETDDYKILEILTYQASKIYGSNTRWCTTSSKEHFTIYNKNWIIYYCILKNPNTLDSAFRTRFHKVAIIVRKRNCEAICYDAIDERRGTDMVKRITEFDFFKICKEDANKKRAKYVILDHINHLKASIKKLNVSKSNLDLINQITKNIESGKI